jgi:hypothetical protein
LTPQVFNRGALQLQDGSIDWAANTIKARLSRTSESSINKDATVMTGIGDAGIGDQTLGSKTGPSEDATNDRIEYSSAAVTFASVTGTEVDKVVIFKFVTNDADSIPIAVVNLNPAITPNGGNVQVTPDAASGWFYSQQ